MPATRKPKTAQVHDQSQDISHQATTTPISSFDPSLAEQMREIITAGLTPSSALDLVMRLIAEVPAASKESMEQIKMLDKLINTARAMMETKLKTEEAAAIAARIDELECQLEALTTSRPEQIRILAGGVTCLLTIRTRSREPMMWACDGQKLVWTDCPLRSNCCVRRASRNRSTCRTSWKTSSSSTNKASKRRSS